MDLERLAPEAYLCSSRLSVAQILEKKVAFRPKSGFLQLFDNSEEIVAKIPPAYLNAIVRQEDGLMKSNEIGNEMLCLVSGEMNVGKAIKESGIKENSGFIVFASDKSVAKNLKELFELKQMKKIVLKLDLNFASEVAAAPLLED